MIKRAHFNLSRRGGLAFLLATAVLAPVVILLFVQYRSFSDLERKTKADALVATFIIDHLGTGYPDRPRRGHQAY
jgi:hypothetical protein